MDDELAALREALRDVGFKIAAAIGLIALCERLGMTLKPWVRERKIRARHRTI